MSNNDNKTISYSDDIVVDPTKLLEVENKQEAEKEDEEVAAVIAPPKDPKAKEILRQLDEMIQEAERDPNDAF